MIHLDYKDSRPIYEQVADRLKELMILGVLEEDGQMPSVRSLATELSINPNTIQRAYAELERNGFIYSVKGRGSFVGSISRLREQKCRELEEKVAGLAVEAKSLGQNSIRPHGGGTVWRRENSMIEATNLTKKFDDILAVDHINAQIREGSVFGLIGTNGAGKSTFLRMAAGVLKPDEGSITIDGMDVYENEAAKRKFFYISDDQYFFGNATPEDMMNYYRIVYPEFDEKRFDSLLKSFGLQKNRKINTFPKGMKKQVSILCGICAGTEYLFCDETFDGLDPVMRQAVKSIFANDMEERKLTPIIASHNLRELEDICDHVGLLHKGGILLSRDLDEMKMNLHKVQCVLKEGMQPEHITGLDILKTERRGKLLTLTVRGSLNQVEFVMQQADPVFYETIPLSLEEIFISETEVVGYDVKKLIF